MYNANPIRQKLLPNMTQKLYIYIRKKGTFYRPKSTAEKVDRKLLIFLGVFLQGEESGV